MIAKPSILQLSWAIGLRFIVFSQCTYVCYENCQKSAISLSHPASFNSSSKPFANSFLNSPHYYISIYVCIFCSTFKSIVLHESPQGERKQILFNLDYGSN